MLQLLSLYTQLEKQPGALFQTLIESVGMLTSKSLEFRLRRVFLEECFIPYLKEIEEDLTPMDQELCIKFETQLGDAVLSQSLIIDNIYQRYIKTEDRTADKNLRLLAQSGKHQ